MAVSEIFIFCIFLFSLQPSTSVKICRDYCGVQSIRFPFRLNNQTDRCGYPGFNLSCKNQDQTTLSLPFSGDFVVGNIDYMFQNIWINDPDSCAPKRLLQGLNISGTPFDLLFPRNYTFLNCSSASSTELPEAIQISCLSGTNFSVMAVLTERYDLPTSTSLSELCSEMSIVLLPISWTSWLEPGYGIGLTWNEPNCLPCESRLGTCMFEDDKGLQIGCSVSLRNGISTGAKIGIMIGVGLPLLLILIVVVYLRGNFDDQNQHSNRSETFSNSVAPTSEIVAKGLDGQSIEAYPITLLGESKRLPRPHDNTCPICLSEYQAKETLRTIPDCNHYFHAICIDEWLKLNAACPLCRNTP